MNAATTATNTVTSGRALAGQAPGLLHEDAGEGRGQGIALIALAAALVAAPFLVYPVFVMKLLCFALFACAFNLLLGFGGLLSIGHALFFGFASYTSAHASKAWGLTPELSIAAGTLVAAALGLLVGSLAIRRQGIYLAMITLALAQMGYFVALQAPFTGGEDGIQGVPRGALLGVLDVSSDFSLYWLVAGLFMAGILCMRRIVHSPFGQVLKAIRDNEPRMVSLGYKVDRYKLLVFVLSAALSGLAGAMKALVFQFASLVDVYWTMSGEVILMTLIGGVGTILGPIVGAAVIVSAQSYLSSLGAWVVVAQGAIFVACVVLFRKGIVGTLADRLGRPL